MRELVHRRSGTFLSRRGFALVLLLALLLLAFGVRLAYWERGARFGQYWLAMDSDEYFRGGVLFSQGHWLSDPAPQRYTRGPGYPLFLAAIFAAFGPVAEIALFFQVALSLLTVALLYAATRRAFGPRAGLAAAALIAIAPGYAASSGSDFMTETLFAFLLVFLLYLLWRWSEQGMTVPQALGCGLLLGYAALTRPAALAFFPLAAGWLLLRLRPRWRLALTRLAVVLAGILLVILPYTARNYLAYHRFLLIETSSNYTLWNDHANHGDNVDETLARIPNPGDRANYATQRGVQNILADPIQKIGVQGLANLRYLWHFQLDSYARSAGYLMDVVTPGANLPLVLIDDLHFILITLLATLGLAHGWRRAPSLFLLWAAYILALTFMTHAEARFRLQFYFVLTMLAGTALAGWRGLWRTWSRPVQALAVAAIVLVLASAYSPRLEPLLTSEYHLARGNTQEPQFQELEAAVAAYPTYVTAYDVLGDAYRRTGQLDRALEAYAHAIRINPDEMQAHFGRFDIFRQQNLEKGMQVEMESLRSNSQELDIPAAIWPNLNPFPTRRVDLRQTAKSVGYVMNFHGLEGEGNAAFRWTQRRSFIHFTQVDQISPQQLAFRAAALELPGHPLPEIEIYINGSRLEALTVESDWNEYVVSLAQAPREAKDWIVEFRAPTFRPDRVLPDSTDSRELGIMMKWVELR